MTYAVLNTKPAGEFSKTGIESSRVLADSLCGVLADSFVLMIKTQSYHWNVVGPMFHSIHQMTEEQYRDVFEAIDVIAERVRALGHIAPSSFVDLLSHAELDEETRPRDASTMILRLVSDNERIAQRFRKLAAEAAGAGDGATEDLANARMSAHEKFAWMLRATIAE